MCEVLDYNGSSERQLLGIIRCWSDLLTLKPFVAGFLSKETLKKIKQMDNKLELDYVPQGQPEYENQENAEYIGGLTTDDLQVRIL